MYGITGAAMATGISLLIFNVAKYLFLKFKFGFGPFTWKSGVTLILGAVAYYVSTFLPRQDLIIDIVFRSSIITMVFVPIALALRLSEDVNDFMGTIRKRFGF